MSRESELLAEIDSLKTQLAEAKSDAEILRYVKTAQPEATGLGKRRQMTRAQFDSLSVPDKHKAVREYQLVD